MVERVDQTDLLIMKELQKNCRQSFRKLGRKVGVSSSTVKNRVERMERQQIIDRFVTFVEPEIFGYKTVYLLVAGIDIQGNSQEREKLYNTLTLAGKIAEQRVCLGRINAFELLVKKDDIEKNLNLLEKHLGQSLTILGIRGQIRHFSNSKKELTETDYRLIRILVKNPRAEVEDIAQAIDVTTKTVKRRLDRLIDQKLVSFSSIFRPEALRAYLIFTVLLSIRDGISSSKVMAKIRSHHGRYLFSEPIIKPKTILLTLFSENVFELDSVYRQIAKESMGIEKSWLFVDLHIKVLQNWLSNELEKILIKTHPMPLAH
jgi:DNA-binding Lrp family transcriptional regulator